MREAEAGGATGEQEVELITLGSEYFDYLLVREGIKTYTKDEVDGMPMETLGRMVGYGLGIESERIEGIAKAVGVGPHHPRRRM